jgi:hypothetical protein
MGRHPFAGKHQGRSDLPIEIGEYRFAYSQLRSVGLDALPGIPKLSDFPSTIAAAFEQAFGPSGVRKRPTAKEWVASLEELERFLHVCSGNSLHYFAKDAPGALGVEWSALLRSCCLFRTCRNSSAIEAIPALPSAPAASSLQKRRRAGRRRRYRCQKRSVGTQGHWHRAVSPWWCHPVCCAKFCRIGSHRRGVGVAQLAKPPSNNQ